MRVCAGHRVLCSFDIAALCSSPDRGKDKGCCICTHKEELFLWAPELGVSVPSLNCLVTPVAAGQRGQDQREWRRSCKVSVGAEELANTVQICAERVPLPRETPCRLSPSFSSWGAGSEAADVSSQTALALQSIRCRPLFLSMHVLTLWMFATRSSSAASSGRSARGRREISRNGFSLDALLEFAA